MHAQKSIPVVTFVRPEGDSVENALSAWAAPFLATATGYIHVSITDLKGLAVTRPAVERQLGLSNATVYFGHGEVDRWGFPNTLVDSGNISKASNRVLISIACKAAASLGNDAVSNQKGVKSFIGFDDELVVYLAIHSLFGEVVQRAIEFLILGASVDDFRLALIDGFKNVESFYRSPGRRDDPNAPIIWLAAHINWRGVVLLGDRSATIL